MRILALLLLLSMQAGRFGLADTAYLDRSEIHAGDVIELIIETDHPYSTLPPIDTGPLRRDFRILGTSSKVSRVRQANGKSVHRAQWRIQLTTERTGRLQLPSLTIGDRQSPQLSVEVRPVDPLDAGRQVFVELQATPEKPYTGQQTRLDIRAYFLGDFERTSLVEPRVEGATIFRHQDERRYLARRNGREFQVLERSLSLFPRQGGELSLGRAEFRGKSGGRWLARQSAALALDVRPPPPAANADSWLPARQIDIAIRGIRRRQDLQPGRAIEFSLTLIADGIAAVDLPTGLMARDSDGLKVFADREQRQDRLVGDRLIGRIDQRYVLIATRAGDLELPGLTLDWWSTDSDVARRATLPATPLRVADPRVNQPLAAPGPATRQPWLVSLAGLAIVCAGAGTLVFRHRRFRHWRIRIGRAYALVGNRRRLKRACRGNHARLARAGLIEWGRLRWPGKAIRGLRDLQAVIADASLRRQLAQLDAANYAATPVAWDGDRLWRALRRATRNGVEAEAATDAIPGLYPAPGR